MDTQKKIALAARYRPQTFADVAGQEMVKKVLSRVCEEDRPACAYLFSGTRGVGKTTIARIFAKALNCEKAPCREPCNQCESCQSIMRGSHIDVVEIDGASNNGVEDVRTLRETVGYAPMEGRYKIFIIDEAHMMSKAAFNALLKTLEEPPPRVIFMMATTEANKFPVTIVSRCQHFVFRHLNEDEITTHLKNILAKEDLPYEEDAVKLIAKRAQGSVRDSMSLLDQTLSYGDNRLTVPVAREVLGLAGQEFFEQLFDAIHTRDCAAVVTLTRTLLRSGVDIGFFVRELATYFRNFFFCAQAGQTIFSALDLSPGETALISRVSGRFSAAHLHAAWQLVLDAQRSVVLSSDPASALELLLLNLTVIPQLLPLEQLPAQSGTSGSAGGGPGTAPGISPGGTPGILPDRPRQEPVPPGAEKRGTPLRTGYESRPLQPEPAGMPHEPVQSGHQESGTAVPPDPGERETGQNTAEAQDADGGASENPKPASYVSAAQDPITSEETAKTAGISLERGEAAVPSAGIPEPADSPSRETGTSDAQPGGSDDEDDDEDEGEDLTLGDAIPSRTLNMEEFGSFYAQWTMTHGGSSIAEHELPTIHVLLLGNTVQLKPDSSFTYDRIQKGKDSLERAFRAYLNDSTIVVEIAQPKTDHALEKELIQQASSLEALQPCLKILGAVVESCRKI